MPRSPNRRSKSRSRSRLRKRSGAYRKKSRSGSRRRAGSRRRSRSLVPCKPYQVRRLSPPRRCVGSKRNPGISSSSPFYNRLSPVSMLKPCKPYQKRRLSPPRRCIGRKDEEDDYLNIVIASSFVSPISKKEVIKQEKEILKEKVKQAPAGSIEKKQAEGQLKIVETKEKVEEKKEEVKQAPDGSAKEKQAQTELAKVKTELAQVEAKVETELAKEINKVKVEFERANNPNTTLNELLVLRKKYLELRYSIPPQEQAAFEQAFAPIRSRIYGNISNEFQKFKDLEEYYMNNKPTSMKDVEALVKERDDLISKYSDILNAKFYKDIHIFPEEHAKFMATFYPPPPVNIIDFGRGYLGL